MTIVDNVKVNVGLLRTQELFRCNQGYPSETF